ncbi:MULTISPECIES: hypothetical protein [unclassified Methylobacterium]|uniref:hypothetical protein n=1 Tax=unclassified Methylobacterium TaxID=2615210 RepID=UPI00226A171E|nr:MULTISPECIES: hypothetical protein [unclassified Methylobacterium]
MILGASNADIELRPPVMMDKMPCAVVDNLSIGNENITELRQTALIALKNRQLVPGHRDIYVLGIWFGLFGDSKDRWNSADRPNAETDLDLEFQRYGVYTKQGELYRPWGGASFEPLLSVLVSPFAMVEKISRAASLRARSFFFVRPDVRSEGEREAASFSDEQKAAAVRYWHQQLGFKDQLSSTQFALLEKTIADITQDGDKVVIVDLPIPDWWASAVPMYREYKDKISEMKQRFVGNDAVKFIEVNGYPSQASFSDEVHAKPSVAKAIGETIATYLNRIGCTSSGSASEWDGRFDHGHANEASAGIPGRIR